MSRRTKAVSGIGSHDVVRVKSLDVAAAPGATPNGAALAVIVRAREKAGAGWPDGADRSAFRASLVVDEFSEL
jgi:hypothetical protein